MHEHWLYDSTYHQSLEIPRQRPRKPNNDDDSNDDIYNNYYYYHHFMANIQDDWR